MNFASSATMGTALTMVLSIIVAGGCVGVGPSTQEGALAGAAAGAAAGAIIGHNRSDGATLEGALIGAALGSLAGGVWGNRIDHETGRIYDSQGKAYTQRVYDRIPIPPKRIIRPERVGEPPSIGAIWISASWVFTDGSYRWRRGRWEVPPPGHRQYVGAHWESRDGGYIYIHSHWR